MDMTSEFDKALTTFNRAFAAGDAEPFIGLFAEDARVLLHEHPALVGRADIGQMFIELFATVDTAGFEVDYNIVDFHDDRAYVLATFRETLRPKDGAPAIASRGGWCAFGGEGKMAPGRSVDYSPGEPPAIASSPEPNPSAADITWAPGQ